MAVRSAITASARWFDKPHGPGRRLPGPVVTISGPHGTGKSTYAKALADALHLRYICAGEIFRELAKEQNQSLQEFSRRAAEDPEIDRILDERTKAEARKGSVVIDAQLGAWMAKGLVDVSVIITAPDEVRFERIAEREGTTVEEARKETEYRESVQLKRYMQYYGVNVSDLSIYDLKIDTGTQTIEDAKRTVIEEVSNLLAKRGKLTKPT